MLEWLGLYINKGIVIGLISAIAKGASEIKHGTFMITMFFADLVMACLVGYSMWELMRPSPMALWLKYFLTAVISINGFVVVTLVTNAKYIMLLLRVLLLRDRHSIDEFVDAYGLDNDVKTTKTRRNQRTRYESPRQMYQDDDYVIDDELYSGQPFEDE